ncbi:nucleotidyltransferase domain-containing protein [Anaerorhabdus sp.]|uniref:nucleotidyltransferase domain-containing protein n=1 Tax=Anaerorhabdus sp. TaxID=1872524 RepID=UPI002FC76D2A
MENKKEIVTKENLFTVLDLIESLEMTYWLDGGWGVDALVGYQTRNHRDIDINFDANETAKFLEILTNVGYQIDTDERPVRIELYHSELGYLDIHPFIIEKDGSSKQAALEGGFYDIPAIYFGSTTFEGRNIPCINLEGQRVFHTGYELREVDKHDIEHLD